MYTTLCGCCCCYVASCMAPLWHVQGLQGLRHRRKLRRAASSSGGMLEGGGLSEVQLEWRDLTCTLAGKKGGSSRLLLNQVSGCAAAGRLTAIMGPSGSGKTTLLAALANQMPFSPRVTLRVRWAAHKCRLHCCC